MNSVNPARVGVSLWPTLKTWTKPARRGELLFEDVEESCLWTLSKTLPDNSTERSPWNVWLNGLKEKQLIEITKAATHNQWHTGRLSKADRRKVTQHIRWIKGLRTRRQRCSKLINSTTSEPNDFHSSFCFHYSIDGAWSCTFWNLPDSTVIHRLLSASLITRVQVQPRSDSDGNPSNQKCVFQKCSEELLQLCIHGLAEVCLVEVWELMWKSRWQVLTEKEKKTKTADDPHIPSPSSFARLTGRQNMTMSPSCSLYFLLSLSLVNPTLPLPRSPVLQQDVWISPAGCTVKDR